MKGNYNQIVKSIETKCVSIRFYIAFLFKREQIKKKQYNWQVLQ